MFLGGNDDGITLRFLHGKQYEPMTRNLWRILCKDAELVADIGAHTGTFTLDAFGAGAKTVFSAEPHPINYSRLILNLRYNGLPCGGVWYGAMGHENKVDMLLVKQMFLCHAAGRVGMHNENGVEIPVRVCRLDSLVEEAYWKDLKVVKIDAENYTLNALIGMGGILNHKPDLILECTQDGMDEVLKPLGYKFWKIWETGALEEVDTLTPYNPGNNYNGTDEDCRNRFCTVRGLPEGLKHG
jgi:FkbM family methyltransferase